MGFGSSTTGAGGPPAMTGAGVVEGVRRILPLSLFVVPFGLAFGAAAVEKGLSPAEAMLMSALVFAGASQFAALDLWGETLPLLSIALVVLAVNARHLILGASLSPYMRTLPRRERLLALAFMTDANFADSYAAFRSGARDVGILLGGGLWLWVAWNAGTAAGAVAGSSAGDLDRFGIDVVMLAFFTALVTGAMEGRRSLVPVIAAVIVAILTIDLLPTGWNVVVAALAGGLAGGLFRGA